MSVSYWTYNIWLNLTPSLHPQVPVLRVRSFKLRQEEWYGSLPGHTVRHHRSVSLSPEPKATPVILETSTTNHFVNFLEKTHKS